MKQGALVRLPDGRVGTAVYHGLDGYGIRWGRIPKGEGWAQRPEAMLRDPYPTAIKEGLECVGEDFEVIE